MTRQLWQRLKPLIQETFRPRRSLAEPAKIESTDANRSSLLTGPIEVRFTESLGSSVFRPGNTILDRFRIIRSLGHGGMGEVFEAEDLRLGRIALKTIREGIGPSSSLARHFRQEVQLARHVSGPQICRIHDLFELPPSDGRPAIPFLTMEYLDGVTLAQKLKSEGTLGWKDVRPIALEICAGLQLIHEKGIIHRDLKPSNVMLCRTGDSTRVVLTDFGLASRYHATDRPGDATTLTSSSDTSDGGGGTVAYMAPEQFETGTLTPAAEVRT